MVNYIFNFCLIEITALSRSQTMELSTPESLASPDSSTSPPSPGDFLELIRPRTWESLEVQEARAKEALEFREAYQAHKVSKVSKICLIFIFVVRFLHCRFVFSLQFLFLCFLSYFVYDSILVLNILT